MYADLSERFAQDGNVEVREYICFGNCEEGANAVVYPDRVWFSKLRSGDSAVVTAYLTEGDLSDRHTGHVDELLAETIWEILELDDSPGEESVG
jgi:(2Fe-2S) ferredoxin